MVNVAILTNILGKKKNVVKRDKCCLKKTKKKTTTCGIITNLLICLQGSKKMQLNI